MDRAAPTLLLRNAKPNVEQVIPTTIRKTGSVYLCTAKHHKIYLLVVCKWLLKCKKDKIYSPDIFFLLERTSQKHRKTATRK